MRKRCYDPKNKDYKDYGARGIVVCDRWRFSFENFLSDMGEKPVGLTLERKNTNGNYEPDNCRWASIKEQARNKRTNAMLTFLGETLPQSVWAERLGFPEKTISCRIHSLKWSVADALSTPIRPMKKPEKKK